jgi:hypothetical protein
LQTSRQRRAAGQKSGPVALTLCLAIWAGGYASTPKSVEDEARNTEAADPIVVPDTTFAYTKRYQSGVDEPDAAQINGLIGFLIGADVERGDRQRASMLADALARKGLFPAISYDMKAAIMSAEIAKAFVEVAHNAKTLSDLRSMALGLMGPKAKSTGSRIERVKRA